MSESPSGMVDVFKRGCIGILVGAIALYVAVKLVEGIWPWLVGIGGGVLVVWIGVAVYKSRHERW